MKNKITWKKGRTGYANGFVPLSFDMEKLSVPFPVPVSLLNSTFSAKLR